jgi:type I restriction enzyme M protein
VGAAKYFAARGGGSDASFTGHAVSQRSATLAGMNLRLHGVSAEVDAAASAVFQDDAVRIPEKRFDVVLTNPPFDLKAPMVRLSTFERYGWLLTSRSDFLWLQYVASSIGEDGRAAIVMPGSALFREGVEQQIRANLVDCGIVEAIIALPPQLFVSTAVPVSVWLLSRSERRRADEILLVDASALGNMISRTQRSLSDEDRSRIVDAVTTWRAGGYEDVRGFSASVTVSDIRAQDHVLTPARYVGSTITVDAPSVSDLRDELARLEQRAREVNAVVERRLDRIQVWIR